jgi:hypothetical protein
MISIVSNYIYYFSFFSNDQLNERGERKRRGKSGRKVKKHGSHRDVVNGGEERADIAGEQGGRSKKTSLEKRLLPYRFTTWA